MDKFQFSHAFYIAYIVQKISPSLRLCLVLHNMLVT